MPKRGPTGINPETCLPPNRGSKLAIDVGGKAVANAGDVRKALIYVSYSSPLSQCEPDVGSVPHWEITA